MTNTQASLPPAGHLVLFVVFQHSAQKKVDVWGQRFKDDGAILSWAWLPPELPCIVHATVPRYLTTEADIILYLYTLKASNQCLMSHIVGSHSHIITATRHLAKVCCPRLQIVALWAK